MTEDSNLVMPGPGYVRDEPPPAFPSLGAEDPGITESAPLVLPLCRPVENGCYLIRIGRGRDEGEWCTAYYRRDMSPDPDFDRLVWLVGDEVYEAQDVSAVYELPADEPPESAPDAVLPPLEPPDADAPEDQEEEQKKRTADELRLAFEILSDVVPQGSGTMVRLTKSGSLVLDGRGQKARAAGEAEGLLVLRPFGLTMINLVVQ